MTHRLLAADYLDLACGLVTGPGITFTLASTVTCPACLAALAAPLFARKPTTPHPLARTVETLT